MWRFHLGDDTVSGTGVLEVRRGPGILGRIACAVLGLPRTCTAAPARVTVRRSRAAGPAAGETSILERWERRIGAQDLLSEQVRIGERGWEPHGPLEIRTRTVATPTEVNVVQEGAVVRIGRREFAVPKRLAPRVSAHAWVETGDRARMPPRFHIEVRVTAPLIGEVMSYRGHMDEEAQVRP
ncbi:hypothetical protein GCM10022226_26720 [Sphaerisporangium flaviroseum]|uniref:DUF4166 domain-containing protein n=2 Tax=Sphaerisporangium flaviroseum TaxID=509199 RepID=A0ABP7I3Q5_9ACTN